VPSVAEEDARRLHRERDRLVSERALIQDRTETSPSTQRKTQPLLVIRRTEPHILKTSCGI
jgi:hypothetical protein